MSSVGRTQRRIANEDRRLPSSGVVHVAVWVWILGHVPAFSSQAGWVPRAIPAQNSWYQTAGQSVEHRSTMPLWHQWHWSLLTGSTTSLGWIPKQVFFGQLSSGTRPQCGPVRRYKDTDDSNMKRCGLRHKSLSTAPFDRAQWRTTCQSATASFGVADCRAGQEMGSSQAAGHQHQQHGLAVWQTQQDLLITDWALCPSACPSVMQSIIFDGKLHVCVCFQYFDTVGWESERASSQ